MDTDTGELGELPPGYKYMPCRYCDKAMPVLNNRRKLPFHSECSVRAAAEASRQMNAKQGPYYDAWLESMAKRFAKRL